MHRHVHRKTSYDSQKCLHVKGEKKISSLPRIEEPWTCGLLDSLGVYDDDIGHENFYISNFLRERKRRSVCVCMYCTPRAVNTRKQFLLAGFRTRLESRPTADFDITPPLITDEGSNICDLLQDFEGQSFRTNFVPSHFGEV